MVAVRQDTYVGYEAQSRRGILAIIHPIKNGNITEWDDMERIWDYMYKRLRVKPEEHPILHTDDPCNTRDNREKMTEVW